ncbi:MAG: hypothetical protein RR288_02145, partial [Oscillibacter sp.]
VLAATDAFTTGSGLLVENRSYSSIVTVPLVGKTCIHLGWIRSKGGKISPQTEKFIQLLEKSVEDSIRYTEQIRAPLYDDEES